MFTFNPNKTSRPLVVVLMVLWTVIIVVSLLWGLFEMKHRVIDTARIQADMAYNKNIIYRRWNTEHGGVYVEVTDELQPNKYLSDLPERDVTTPSGKTLTLINPALMMRQIYEMTRAEHDIIERLVSLTPLNPDNMADPWEAEALRSLASGSSEGVSKTVVLDGAEYMRQIRPLVTEKSCLRCHAGQGYREGDVHGGISIMLPMTKLRETASKSAATLVTAHIVLWFLGSGAIFWVAMRLRRAELDRIIMSEELMKAQKHESLGILAGGIAHDYNNLLTAIMANISLAIQMERSHTKADGTENVALESLLDAEKATQMARDLSKQLMTFAKGEAPVKELVPDVGRLIRESAGFALRGSNVCCEFSIPGGLFTIEADTGQINQVLQNLMINADQAMPGGGVVRVKAENLTLSDEALPPLKPGRYLKVTIEDQGVGIPKEHLSKVFDPYFTTKESGSGLGLATVYSIIKSHGGHIAVESNISVGTTFTIYLPASDKKAVSIAPSEEEQVALAVAGEGKGRVLVMDSEELVRNAACRILCEVGYETVSARDGTEAIDLYMEAKQAGRPFALLIMDLTVPGAGGLGAKETLEELLELSPEARAVVSTGYPDDPILEDFRKYGFKGVVVKPYDIEELKRVIYEVISAEEK